MPFRFENLGRVELARGSLVPNSLGTSSGVFYGEVGAVITFGGEQPLFESTSLIESAGRIVFATNSLTRIAGTYDVTGITAVRRGGADFSGDVISLGETLTVTDCVINLRSVLAALALGQVLNEELFETGVINVASPEAPNLNLDGDGRATANGAIPDVDAVPAEAPFYLRQFTASVSGDLMLDVHAASDSRLTPFVRILDERGLELVRDGDVRNVRNVRFVTPVVVGRNYFVQVSAAPLARQEERDGAFELSIETQANSPSSDSRRSLTLNGDGVVAVSGTLSAEVTRQEFEFTATLTGQTRVDVRADRQPGNQFASQVSVRNSLGVEPAMDAGQENKGSSQLFFEVVAGQSYVVTVKPRGDAAPDAQVGSYTLNVSTAAARDSLSGNPFSFARFFTVPSDLNARTTLAGTVGTRRDSDGTLLTADFQRFTAPADGVVVFSRNAAANGPLMPLLFSYDRAQRLQVLGEFGPLPSRLKVERGVDYFLQVTAAGGATGRRSSQWACRSIQLQRALGCWRIRCCMYSTQTVASSRATTMSVPATFRANCVCP